MPPTESAALRRSYKSNVYVARRVSPSPHCVHLLLMQESKCSRSRYCKIKNLFKKYPDDTSKGTATAAPHRQPCTPPHLTTTSTASITLCVPDEGRDLLASLTVRLASGYPSLQPSSCLSACLAELRPPHQRSAPALSPPPSPPLWESARLCGHSHWSAHCCALTARQVPFLFCSLVFLPPLLAASPAHPLLIFSLRLFQSAPSSLPPVASLCLVQVSSMAPLFH